MLCRNPNDVISFYEMQAPRYPKVVMAGDVRVGKTSLVQRMVYDQFQDDCRATVAMNFERLPVETEQGTLTLDIYDVPGDQKIEMYADVGMRDASAALLCFTSEKTFAAQAEILRAWIERIRNCSEKCKILLVLTKSDLLPDKDVYQFAEECAAFIEEMGLHGPVRTSAAMNYGIDRCKEKVALMAHENWSPPDDLEDPQKRCRC